MFSFPIHAEIWPPIIKGSRCFLEQEPLPHCSILNISMSDVVNHYQREPGFSEPINFMY